jgi:hypothetical protein
MQHLSDFWSAHGPILTVGLALLIAGVGVCLPFFLRQQDDWDQRR